ncbi:protein pangolin, isoforms A/H/I/S isoform X3 [Leguminivora glycinivorella]|uniref:protein pangolin, isoforms A/H/I/S isoform X3 n=1 Tax=Leguminivora glycinivorella TaxID=1035111 RepID=UPI00200BE662|nr:protein pangolin, isoforms A/H/I/S isoform X3 [Leguminivora glycinivorella]
MPHAHSSSAASSGGDDLGSTDEVKVFKDEGDGEDEKRSSENLLEEKSSLIDWTESEEKSGEPYSGKLSVKSDLSPVFGKFDPHPAGFNMGYLMAPYPYPNGGAHPLPVSMAGKMGLPAGGSLSLFCPGGDLGQPPPAHMGIPPPYQLDSKLAAGLARTPMYPFPGGTYPYPMLSPEMSQVAASWHTPSMYPISSAASSFRSPYPTSLPISTSSLSSELYRFSPTLGGGLGLGLGPALVPPPPSKADLESHHARYARSLEKGSSSATDKPTDSTVSNNSKEQNKKPHIKKPLNAFMLYMKEMRAKVVAECTLKESAAINQILGRRWHSLSREEQAKYYEKARQERQLHMQLYPGWSARDNYGYGSKKKKRKKDRSPAELGGNNLKKCRARYGLDQQNQWCKPCSPESSSVLVSGGLGLLRPEAPLVASPHAHAHAQEPTYVNL